MALIAIELCEWRDFLSNRHFVRSDAEYTRNVISIYFCFLWFLEGFFIEGAIIYHGKWFCMYLFHSTINLVQFMGSVTFT